MSFKFSGVTKTLEAEAETKQLVYSVFLTA